MIYGTDSDNNLNQTKDDNYGFVVDSNSEKSNNKSDNSETESDCVSEAEAEDSSDEDSDDSELQEECYAYTSDEE